MSRYLGFEPTSNNTSYFFVSYDSGDTDRISPIVTRLHKNGLDMWYDHGIEYGENWSGQLAERIGKSSAVLMFLSKGTFRKEESFVYKEYIMAKEFYQKKIYIVLLDNISNNDLPAHWLPWWIEIKQRQCIQAWQSIKNEDISALLVKAIYPTAEKHTPASYVLEELLKNQSRLKQIPAGYRYIRLLVFVVMDSDGNRFIPFQYPRYGSIWTTPHIDFGLIPDKDIRFTDISKILRQFERWMDKYADIFNILERHQLYQMGMFNAESEKYTAYTEYKVSPTFLDRYQCYRVDEHHVTYVDPDEMINIYDPEKLHGYKYFPLDQKGFADQSSQYVQCSGEDVFFFGKKLSTNIVRLLGSNQRFADCTYQLPDNVCMDENGITSSLYISARETHLYIPTQEHHLHGLSAPASRSFSTTVTDISTTL